MFANIGVYIASFGGIGCSCCFWKSVEQVGRNGNGGYYDSSDVYYSNLVNTLIGSILVLIL